MLPALHKLVIGSGQEQTDAVVFQFKSETVGNEEADSSPEQANTLTGKENLENVANLLEYPNSEFTKNSLPPPKNSVRVDGLVVSTVVNM
jgi:hypothetical protein